MNFYDQFVFNNFMLFDDATLDMFLQFGEITQKTHDAAKKNRANFLAQQQNSDTQTTEQPQQ